MADFIIHRNRKIPVDPYPFPKGALKIYGSGKFYNGFSIGASNNLTVVNEDGVLKFSRGASKGNEHTTVILGTIPKNTKQCIYVDVAIAVEASLYLAIYVNINNNSMLIGPWTEVKIYNTVGGPDNPQTNMLQAGGVLAIDFMKTSALSAIPNLCSVRAIWAL